MAHDAVELIRSDPVKSEMLPQTEKLLGKEELARLGEEMLARKRQLGG